MAVTTDATVKCAVCALHSETPEDEIILETENFIATVSDRYLWGIVLATKRHNSGIWAMNEAEAAEYGPLSVKLSSAMVSTWTKLVYTAAMGEGESHFHAMFFARAPRVTDAMRNEMYRYATDMAPQEDEAHAGARAVRQALQSVSL